MYKLAKIYDVFYAQHVFLHCFGGPFFQCCFPCPKKTCLVPTNQLAKASPNAVNTQQSHLTTLHSDLTTQQTWWILPMRGIRCRCLGFPQFPTGFSTGHFFLNQQKKKRGEKVGWQLGLGTLFVDWCCKNLDVPSQASLSSWKTPVLGVHKKK